MKASILAVSSALLILGAAPVHGQESPGEVEQLRRQLKAATENFDKMMKEQKQVIDSLSQRLDDLQKKQSATEEKAKLADQLGAELAKNAPPIPAPAAGSVSTAWSPAAPLTIARAGSAYMNISFDTLMDVGGSTVHDPSRQLQLGDHDPIKNGFSLRNAEISLDGAVDPYFKGFANIALKLDQNNETSIELEEAYVQSTSLPDDLQLKGGQFYAAFGRQNPQHPHSWAFVDLPIILSRAFGPDGLRSIGAQMSWLVPLPFYTELFLGVFDGQGGTAASFRSPGDPGPNGNQVHGHPTFERTLSGPQDLVYVPRLASSFELTDHQTLVAGVSGAFGPNETGDHSRTEIYGVDAYWKWKPSNASEGFPFVSWQTEFLYSRFGAGASPAVAIGSENLHDWGMYSQVLYGFRPHWVAGLRGEYASGDTGQFDLTDPFRGERSRVSPNLTWYPSEFSKIRLQYNYDMGEYLGNQHAVWMQFEFLLGAHAAHKF